MGNLEEYLRGNADALAGEWTSRCPAEIRPGVWIEDEAHVAASARLEPPVVIGRSAASARMS